MSDEFSLLYLIIIPLTLGIMPWMDSYAYKKSYMECAKDLMKFNFERNDYEDNNTK